MIYKIRDFIYPTDNQLEIPALRMDMQAGVCESSFLDYGEDVKFIDGHSTLCFYTYDRVFANVFKNPEIIKKYNPKSIVEANYTLSNEMPISLGLSLIYKKRWLSRTWQEMGYRIFVDMNVSNKYYLYNMLGVPKGWSAYATRGYSERLDNLMLEYELARERADGNDIIFVIYGGGDNVRKFAEKHHCIYVHPLSHIFNKRKRIKKRKDKYSSTFDIDYEKTNKIQLPQIENYL